MPVTIFPAATLLTKAETTNVVGTGSVTPNLSLFSAIGDANDALASTSSLEVFAQVGISLFGNFPDDDVRDDAKITRFELFYRCDFSADWNVDAPVPRNLQGEIEAYLSANRILAPGPGSAFFIGGSPAADEILGFYREYKNSPKSCVAATNCQDSYNAQLSLSGVFDFKTNHLYSANDYLTKTEFFTLFNGIRISMGAHAKSRGQFGFQANNLEANASFSGGQYSARVYWEWEFSYTISPESETAKVKPGDIITLSSDPSDPDALDFSQLTIEAAGIPVVPITQTQYLFIFMITWEMIEAAESGGGGIDSLLSIVAIGNGTQFSGSVMLGYYGILLIEGSGIYQITFGQRHDTLYDAARDGTTIDVKIPNPFIETGYVRDGE